MIDSQIKRMSVQAYTFGLLRPPATGTIGAPERSMLSWLYAGFVYTPIVVIEGAMVRDQRRRGRSISLYGRG